MWISYSYRKHITLLEDSGYFSGLFYFVQCYHTIIPVSLSGPFSPSTNSTLPDLRPFRSSKWLCSVTTLQPEWETCWRVQQRGWQTQTWQRRRGNATLIIHPYCRIKKNKQNNQNWSAMKINLRPGARDRKRERVRGWPKWWGIPRAVVHSEIQSCASLGPWGWGNSIISCQKSSERKPGGTKGRWGSYLQILWKPAH